MRLLLLACLLIPFLTTPAAYAEVRLPSIFGSHMVLQRQQQNRVWGWAEAGEQVTVTIADQNLQTTADQQGKWMVRLASMEAGGPHVMQVRGKNSLSLENVMIGEVWVCSGQSNMQWSVDQANDPDLEKLTARFPNLRLITVPQVGTQEPQDDFKGQWQACTPESVATFSAVGYFFGRQLHQTLGVPVGLIDNAWGGSACEAWVRRDLLEDEEQYQPLLAKWKDLESTFDYQKELASFRERLAQWETQAKQRRADGRQVGRRPRAPRNQLAGQHRPANLYNGVLKPIIGYGIRGAIWYQGESNAGRAYQYRDLFPLMIKLWRDEWGQGDFPFYWVQLADFLPEKPQPSDSTWAELREAQTMAMSRLPNTGEAVIVNLGEASDIHPKNKQDVAKRLARWALARDYGFDLVYRSPIYKGMEKDGTKIVLTFDHVGGGLDTFDVNQPIGFTIAGQDQQFVKAEANIIGKNQIEVWHESIEDPQAVRYAWADNPVCNVQNRSGLPLTPFRTDQWKGITADVLK